MIEYFSIFTKQGLILWQSKRPIYLQENLMNEFIKVVFLEERTASDSFSYDNKYAVKWTQENEKDIVFAAVYQKMLPKTYVDDFLNAARIEFMNSFGDKINQDKESYPFDQQFDTLLKEIKPTKKLIDRTESSGSGEKKEEVIAKVKKVKTGGLLSFFTSLSNRELTEADLQPVLAQFSDHLISKNVAKEIAEKLCASVTQNLVGKQLNTFTISTTVKQAMEDALTRILTPKKQIDILREARAAKDNKKPYVIVFVGVNGVGKSTSLAKVCSWLLENNLKVMLAACDTFRAGAIEQLQVHAENLNVEVFHKGYGRDSSVVAKLAIQQAKNNGFDVVLIDTAGRMQDNEPLMKALAKLVGVNKPDLVLFVGEALVGNMGIEQLVKFNKALEDFGTSKYPRGIDGIFLTKVLYS